MSQAQCYLNIAVLSPRPAFPVGIPS